MPKRFVTLVVACTASVLVGCTQTINQYRVVDVQSRREYTAVGQPNFMNGGGLSFRDRDTARMIVLQSYELYGLEGEQLTVTVNPWTGRSELKKGSPAKKK